MAELTQALRAKILAFDPGGTTGWTRVHLYPRGQENSSGARFEEADRSWDGGQFGPGPHHKALYKFLIMERPLHVVCESFQYRVIQSGGATMPGIRLDSVEYIGVIKLYCELTKTPLFLQTAGEVKPLWTDEKLKKLGLWARGEQHRRDAVRHALHHIITRLNRTEFIDPLRPKE